MSDLIERQVAKNAICNACGKIDCDQMDTCEKLKLPSVQPDLPIKEKCAFCPHCNNCDVNDDLSIQPCVDTISRKAAIDALWKALYEYEDKTEKQFIESEELDVADWIQHRIFVQNMSDIDRQTIRDLPSAQPVAKDINVPINDCISRQAAIDAVKGLLDSMLETDTIGFYEIENILFEVPSAQPEDCDTCKHGYFGDSHCDNCRVRYPSHYERRTE